MKRRNLLKGLSLAGLAGIWNKPAILWAEGKHIDPILQQVDNDRKYWVGLLDKIASPVLSNLGKGMLRQQMDMRVSPAWDNRDKGVGYLEALGRLAVGLAPWLDLKEVNVQEAPIQARLRQQLLAGIANGADPKSPDYFSWAAGSQPLVDAAFLAQALIKAPRSLWEPLPSSTKTQLIHEFKELRRVNPGSNNWVLFAAMIESFLLSIGQQYDAPRIDTTIDMIKSWYKGDGWYGDGEAFHFDYYNSFVIHPMLAEVLKVNIAHGRREQAELDLAYERMQRYSDCLERLISPEGTYPVFGRSSTYRTAVFQALAQVALDDRLPDWIKPAQVRCALTAVKKRVFVADTFVNGQWLSLGLIGKEQEGLADSYSNTGSMYLTSVSFLPLGLPETHPFWSDPQTAWTMKKAWAGEAFRKDHAIGQ